MDNWQKFEVNINWEENVKPSDIENAILFSFRPHNLIVKRLDDDEHLHLNR